jgi:acetyl-CoA C-acetyltransferase
MRDVVICEPVRTAVGGFGGSFKEVHAHVLGAAVVAGLMERTGLPKDKVDDVIFAQCYPSMDAPALGRVVALDAGLPVEVTGMQIDRRCGSGLQAIINATMQVATGAMDCVIAGGAESMSNAPFYSTNWRWGLGQGNMTVNDGLITGRLTAGGKNFPVPGGMLETAENLRRDYQITRAAQDEFAAASHAKAVAAQASGVFAEEIIPVTVPGRKGDTVVTKDEHPRADSTAEVLGKLKPIRLKQDPEATVTAGNASGQNDGASACLVMTREMAEQYGLKPLARLVSWAAGGVGPAVMGIGPVPSTDKALKRAGLSIKDIDLIELNEAFAAQVLACTKAMGFTEGDYARLNVHGSGISLGHPVGATGAIIATKAIHELQRIGGRYALVTMCIGGGQGIAAVFERT